jgi:hypothetical protein
MQPPVPTVESHHDLYFRPGNAGFYFRNDNHGVTLTADRINWNFNSQADGAPYTNIRAVNLQSGGDMRNPMGTCRITFADGYMLVVTDANDRGVAETERKLIYRDFVHNFHARLAALPQASISFSAGYQGFRYPLIIACCVLLGLICVVGPIAGLIITREIGPLMALFAGVGLYWPLVKSIEKNVPRSYDPRHPPEELLG